MAEVVACSRVYNFHANEDGLKFLEAEFLITWTLYMITYRFYDSTGS